MFVKRELTEKESSTLQKRYGLTTLGWRPLMVRNVVEDKDKDVLYAKVSVPIDQGLPGVALMVWRSHLIRIESTDWSGFCVSRIKAPVELKNEKDTIIKYLRQALEAYGKSRSANKNSLPKFELRCEPEFMEEEDIWPWKQ